MRACACLLLALLLALGMSMASMSGARAAGTAVAGTGTQAAPGATGVLIRCPTEQADVFFDGDRVGKTPLPGVMQLPPGEHTIRVARLGFTPYIDVFKVRNGQVTRLEIELIPVSGVIRLRGSNGGDSSGRVFIDEKYAGQLPLENELSIGSHSVRVERGGFYPESFDVTSIAGQVVDKEVTLKPLPPELNPFTVKPPPPPKWYQKWWVWTLIAVGAAGVTTAIIVPVVLSKRDVCDGLDVCVIPGTNQTAAGLRVSF